MAPNSWHLSGAKIPLDPKLLDFYQAVRRSSTVVAPELFCCTSIY